MSEADLIESPGEGTHQDQTKLNEEQSSTREQSDLISQLEEDRTALETKLKSTSKELEDERRSNKKKELALEQRISDAEDQVTKLEVENEAKRRTISEQMALINKNDLKIKNQDENYSKLFRNLQIEHTARDRGKETIKKLVDTIELVLKGQRTNAKEIIAEGRNIALTEIPHLDELAESLAQQVQCLNWDVLELEDKQQKERYMHADDVDRLREDNRQSLRAYQARISELQYDLAHAQALRESRPANDGGKCPTCSTLVAESVSQDPAQSAPQEPQQDGSTPIRPKRRRRQKKKNKVALEGNTMDPSPLGTGEAPSQLQAPAVAQYESSEDEGKRQLTPRPLKNELGSQHNSDVMSNSSVQTPDDDITVRFGQVIGQPTIPFNPELTQDLTKSPIFEVAIVKPTSDRCVQTRPMQDSAMQTDDLRKSAIKPTSDSCTQTIAMQDSAMQTDDLRKSAIKPTSDSCTQTIAMQDSAMQTADPPQKIAPVHVSTQTTPVEIIDLAKYKTVGTDTQAEDLPQIPAQRDSLSQSSSTKPNVPTKAKNKSKKKATTTQTDEVNRSVSTYVEASAQTISPQKPTTVDAFQQTIPAPTAEQTTFYTDLKAWASYLFSRKVRTIFYTLLILSVFAIVIYSIYQQILASRERDMWLRANDVSRRATIYIRYANGKGMRVAWLWEEKLLNLEEKFIETPEKYLPFRAEY